jgi:cytochrome d ubiquinol oxidase subunit II
MLYATAFSGFYLAMFLVLAALILRPVSFKFRSKVEDARWRAAWDAGLFVSGLVPALIFGVAFGNVIEGVPFRFDDELRMAYEGTLFGLLNPFALLCGLVSVAMIVLHGASYLALKASGPVVDRAIGVAHIAALVAIVLFLLAGVWVAFVIEGYAIAQPIAHDGPSNPLAKTVTLHVGAWLANYRAMPWTMAAPVVAILALAAAPLLLRAGRAGLGFVASGVGVAGIIATAGLSLFPFMLPSSIEPKASLTAWDSSSSLLTLRIMLFVTAVFLPIIVIYTSWVYRVLRGPVTAAFVEGNSHSVY